MAAGAHFWPENLHFLRYVYVTPIFSGQTDPTQWDHNPPCPEVTLDNFGFLVGNCLAAWWAIFQPPCRILAIFGNSEVLTLDVCCGKNMTSPEFRRSQVLSMGSVLNVLSDITQIFLGTSGNQPFSQKIPFFETNFTGKSNEKYAFGVLFMIFLLSPTNLYVIL